MTVIINGIEYVPKAPYTAPEMAPDTAPMDAIKRIVAREFGVTAADLEGPRQTARIAAGRQVAMYLARKTLGLTFQAIGEAFGGRHHGTAIHAWSAVTKRKMADARNIAFYTRLEAELNNQMMKRLYEHTN